MLGSDESDGARDMQECGVTKCWRRRGACAIVLNKLKSLLWV